MSEEKLYTAQRRNLILEQIRDEGSASVNELSEKYGVSGTTIRLDLAALEKNGSIERTHGGAVPAQKPNVLLETAVAERKNEVEKERIASAAVRLIRPDDVILIDSGTTALALANAIAAEDPLNLTIFTNDLTVMLALESCHHADLHMLGGRIRKGFHYCYDAHMLNEMTQYHFTTAFLSPSAISLQTGPTTMSTDMADLKKAMIASSREIVMMVDSSKVESEGFRSFCSLSDIDVMITDHGIPDQVRSLYEEKVGRLIVA